jgi:glutathione S-transferase/GST-like protein
MIDFYGAPTPNGIKVSIALEELEIPYTLHRVDLAAGEQQSPEFLAMNPNGKIPVIQDRSHDSFAVFESGAILVYLAEKTGQLMPLDVVGRSSVIQWLMFQMAAIGPFMGQLHHWQVQRAADDETVAYYHRECQRLFGVLDTQLREQAFLAGAYSIADIAVWPWIRIHSKCDLPLDEFSALADWYARIEQRSGVSAGVAAFEQPEQTE